MGLKSLTECAKLMGVSRQYVHQLVKDGRIKAKRVGNVWVVDDRELTKFIGRKENNDE